MIGGTVERVNVDDNSSWTTMQLAPATEFRVPVTVEFMVDRSVLFEFMDALRPIDRSARREPVEAILKYSAKPTESR